MTIGSYTHPKHGGGMINLIPSAVDVHALQVFAQKVPKAAAAAQRRAINKTLGWLRTHISRGVGVQERIAIGAIRQRLRSYPVKGGEVRGKLWFGLNPLEASRIGRARQTQAGVSVAGRRYRGAFFSKVYGNKADIWIRTASQHFSAAHYPDTQVSTRPRAGRSGWITEHGDRFPLAKAKVSLEQVRPHFETWVKRADERLLNILKQELNFELHKYLKRSARV